MLGGLRLAIAGWATLSGCLLSGLCERLSRVLRRTDEGRLQGGRGNPETCDETRAAGCLTHGVSLANRPRDPAHTQCGLTGVRSLTGVLVTG